MFAEHILDVIVPSTIPSSLDVHSGPSMFLLGLNELTTRLHLQVYVQRLGFSSLFSDFFFHYALIFSL